jgi:hypothetical protein
MPWVNKLRRAVVYHWFLGMSLMLSASAVVADDCRLERVAAVDMIVTKEGQVQIPVEINGIRVQMGIDAGSGLSAVWSGATAALNLQPNERISRGRLSAGGTPLTQTVNINGLKIGNTRWSSFEVLVYPRNKQFPQSLSEDDAVGFLGQGVFSNLDLEFDFGARQLRFYSQKHCPGRVVYWASRYDVLPLQRNSLGNLYISMAINGKLVSTSMSTMNPISTVEEEAARSILGVDRTSAGGDTGNGGDGCSYCRSITLKAQGLEIRNARVNIVNSVSKSCRLSVPKSENGVATYDCLGAFPLRLGVDVLSDLHLYYANGEKKLYFTDAGAKTANAGTEPTNSAVTKH